MKISFAFSCLSAPNDATEKRWTIKLYIIWIRIATSYWWAKSVWGHESTHDQHEKPKIIFAYVILSFGYDFDYSHFFSPRLWWTSNGKQPAWCSVTMQQYALANLFYILVEWFMLMSANEPKFRKKAERMVDTRFFFSLPKTCSFPWPLCLIFVFLLSVSIISVKNGCKKRTERQQIPNLYLGFFFRLVCVCVWCHFLRVRQLFFYLLTRPILLVGQSNFCVLYVRLFFLHRVLCYACVFCQGFYFKKWLLFHLVRVLFRVCMLLLLFAVCRALIRKSLWAFIYIILQWHLTDFFCWLE